MIVVTVRHVRPALRAPLPRGCALRTNAHHRAPSNIRALLLVGISRNQASRYSTSSWSVVQVPASQGPGPLRHRYIHTCLEACPLMGALRGESLCTHMGRAIRHVSFRCEPGTLC